MDSRLQSKQLDIAYFHHKLGRHLLVLEICSSVLAAVPDSPEALYLSALSRIQLKDYEQGARELLAVMAQYHDRSLYNEYYENLKQTRKLAESRALFEEWVRQTPDDFLVHYFLGLVCLDSHDTVNASIEIERALELNPEHAPTWSALAGVRNEQQRFHEAEAYWRKALELVPDSYIYLHNIAGILKARGRADEGEQFYRRTVDLVPTNSGVHSNRLINMLCTVGYSPEDIFRAHQEWEQKCAHTYMKEVCQFNNTALSGRPLRIGYLSGDYRCHPVAFFIQPVLLQHDRTNFEIHLYANIERPDYITEQFKRINCVWHDIYGEDDDSVCDMIRSDGIDILVDLGGHTKDGRLLVFARKPAPIQVTWLGYANTTGLLTVDYRITDSIADPPGTTEHLHSETLFRLPRCFISYCAPINPPAIGPLPAERNGYVTFGAFNNFAKTNEPLFLLWSEVLHRVPESRLLMKVMGSRYEPLSSYIYEQFEGNGIARERIILHDWVSDVMAHLEMFNSVDIALDAFPYNGTTTTCEALFMGVPVVSLAGRAHVSRVGASLLANAGFPELVAESENDYIEKAVGLAGDNTQLLHYRSSMRATVSGSPLMDTVTFTRSLESAYRTMWQNWCQNHSGGEML